MELDHVFVFAGPDDPEIGHLEAIGLTENARRRHLGQGTENVCYYFENMYLECLWVHDLNEVRQPAIARTRLYERSRWRTDGTNPFGLAWRDSDAMSSPPVRVWGYMPPFMAPGGAIDVAVDSDDPHLPMMFKSPGTLPPSSWPEDRRGDLQRPAGLGRVLRVVIRMPAHVAPSAALEMLDNETILDVEAGSGFSISLEIERTTAERPLLVDLPFAF